MWADIADAVAPYGLVVITLLVATYLVCRLIERGFTLRGPRGIAFEVPASKNRKGPLTHRRAAVSVVAFGLGLPAAAWNIFQFGRALQWW